MLDFYYDFSIDIEKKSILIGVDQKYEFEMFYPDNCNFEPKVEYLDSGQYLVSLKNIFRGIDIFYILDSSKIKEEILVTNKKSCKNFSLTYKLKNCLIFYDKKEYVYKVLGRNEIEIFSFSKLKVNYKNHNKKENLENFCRLDVDLAQDKISYIFDSRNIGEECFPISIDPTFNFKTKVRRSGSYLNSDLDKNNYLIISGQTIADEFFDSAVGLPANNIIPGATIDHYTPYSPPGYDFYKKVLISDDVLFEKKCRLMFPYLTDLIEEVNIVVNQDGNETFIGSKPIKSVFVNNIRYDYVDFDLQFNFLSLIRIDALTKLDKDRYGEFSILYSRTLSFLPEILMKFSNSKNFITKNASNFYGNTLTCSCLDTFKPKKIDIIPFKLDFTKVTGSPTLEQIRDSLYRQKDKTSTFRTTPSKVEAGSSSLINYIFDFPNVLMSQWPKTRDYTEVGTEGYTLRRGSSNSFFNQAEAIFVSAINDRSNIQENTEFLKGYHYVDDLDFYFDINPSEATVSGGRISLNTQNFNLFSYQKPTHFLKTNSGVVKDLEDFTISYSSNTEETAFEITKDFFIYEFATSSTPFIPATITVDFLDTERASENIQVSTLTENVLSGSYVVVRSGKKFFKYKIKRSESRKIYFDKNIKNILENADYIGIFPYIPNEATFIYEHISYDVFRKKLVINDLVENTGDIIYDPVQLSILPNSPSEININFRERDKDFGGISKKVSIRDESLFYFFGFDSSTVKIRSFVEITTNTDISGISPQKLAIGSGGVVFNNLYVPSKYKKRILYLNVDAPGFADKVALDIYDKQGNVVEYTGNVSGITEFLYEDPDENRLVEIRINQNELDYSKILIKFLNI